jgi:uncharacterized protein YkwD
MWILCVAVTLAACRLGSTAGLAEAFRSREQIKTPRLEKVEALLLEGTNAFRNKQGRGELGLSPQLATTARSFAEFMAKTEKYGHEADGSEPSKRAKKQDYDACIVAENIAYQYSSEGFTTTELADKLIASWKNSPEHRKNMLDDDVTDAGMGVAHSEKSGRYYAVQLFGRPRSAMVEFEVVNATKGPIEYELDGKLLELPAGTTRTHGQCRSATLTFPWWKKDGKVERLQPLPGDRFEVSKEADHFWLSRKSREPASKTSD